MVDVKERVLRRKPLTAAELACPPCTVCVTGAAGFIASTITCREKDDASTLAMLRAMPEVQEGRLKFFYADLLEEGTFDEAIQGCKYVIHTAAVVRMNCPEKHAFPRLVTPAVKGVANVLGAVNRAPSVERVVMTSSIYAAYGGLHHHDPNHVLTEEDWNVNATTFMPYFLEKTVSEWEAWAMQAQQTRWSLVCINPANVLGPPTSANAASDVVSSAQKMLDGSLYPFVPPLDNPSVDIGDIATAHVLAMVTPEARGRYIICSGPSTLPEAAAILRREFPKHRIPNRQPGFWLTALLFKLTGMLSYAWLKETYNRRTLVSSAKALRELPGLAPLIPLDTTLKDMAQQLIDLGMVPAKNGKKGQKAAATGNGSETARVLAAKEE